MIDLDKFTYDEMELLETAIEKQIERKLDFRRTLGNELVKKSVSKDIEALTILKVKLINMKSQIEEPSAYDKLIQIRLDKHND